MIEPLDEGRARHHAQKQDQPGCPFVFLVLPLPGLHRLERVRLVNDGIGHGTAPARRALRRLTNTAIASAAAPSKPVTKIAMPPRMVASSSRTKSKPTASTALGRARPPS